MAQTTITFSTDTPLTEILNHPVCRISLFEDSYGKCANLTLWHSNDRGLCVFSRMHDVAERLEVGVLNFRSVTTIDEGAISVDFEPLLVPYRGCKLVVEEAETRLESGLKLYFQNGQDLLILPADFPLFLAVSGSCIQDRYTTSEYPLKDYEAVELFSAVSH